MRALLITLLMLASTGMVMAQPNTGNDSSRIEELFDNYFRDCLKLSPEGASQLGLPPEKGYDYDHSGLDDLSDQGLKANFDLAGKYLEQLKGIDTSKITKSQRIDRRILIWILTTQLDGEKFVDNGYLIDHLWGFPGRFLNLMTGYHAVSSLQDARDYLERLRKHPAQLRQAIVRLDRQEKKGVIPPSYIVDRVIAGVEEFIKPAATENILYQDFKSKLDSLKNLDSAEMIELSQQALSTIQDKVYPVYNDFLKSIKAAIPKADSLAGVWKLPDGDKYYHYCLKNFTTATTPPEQVFQQGMLEVKRLQDMGRILLDSIGIKGNKTFGELMNDYRATWNQPEIKDKFFYPDVPDKQQMILTDYRAIVDDAFAKLPQVFSYIPKTKVDVEPVPAYKEQGGLTYYESASLDGRRKATFFINMMQPLAKPNMRNLTYHETIPGHHYQIALQQELTQNRMFKNLLFLSGFGEGWAMYVEDMTAELGWLPDIYSRLAEINSQLFRAVRIVADVGIHYKKWDKTQTLAYMKDNLGWSSENEVDRYIVWPGQAPSYTVGKLKIMELRERAKKALGPKFNLKDFHMVVLQNGSIPLAMLEEMVDDYINRTR
jgi:uncharacterized protein (DUF885 family)